MSWNYRIVKRIYNEDIIETFAIHLIHYDDSGNPELVTEKHCHGLGRTLEELKDEIELLHLAFEKPILNYEDF